MSIVNCEDRKRLPEALEALQPGDCLQVGSFRCLARSAGELLRAAAEIEARGAALVSLAEGLDTRSAQGASFFALCRAMAELECGGRRERQRDGIEKAREEGKYRGRKPIAVDEELFESVTQRWKRGELSARQAMTLLELKPNTFYRRIKEQSANKKSRGK